MNAATPNSLGLTVVEIAGRYSGRVAGALLGLLGADVHRITTGTDEIDEYPLVDPAGTASAIAFDHHKTHHRLTSDAGRAEVAALVEQADVLITSGENTRSEASAESRRLGFAFSGVQVDLTPFGNDGPYRAYRGAELNLAAYGGAAAYIGAAESEPIVPPFMMAAQQAGLLGAVGALAAVRTVTDSSSPLVIDLAEYEALATTHIDGWYPLSFFSGPLPRRAGRRRPGPFLYTLLRCQDGEVCVGMNEDGQWQRFLAAMGTPEWTADERFQDRRTISEHHAEEWGALVEEWLGKQTKEDIRRLAVDDQIPFGPVYTVPDLLASAQLAGRGFFREVDTSGQRIRLPGLPFQLPGGTPPREGTPAAPGAPLAGIRVLDLGWVIAGPMVGQSLADLGADVVKVESRSHMDGARRGIPLIATDVSAGDAGALPNLMPYFNSANRGKRSVVLDLRSEGGRSVFERMLGSTDVLVENFGPGGLEKLLGCSVDHLLVLRPGLVIVRVSLYGQEGPDRSMIGYAPHTTAMGGLDAMCGYGPESITGMMGSNFGDLNAAMYGALGALGALRRGGGVVDLSMVEANAAHLAPAMVEAQLTGVVHGPCGNRHRRLEPHGIFRCAGDDAWISVACRDDEERERLGHLLGVDASAPMSTALADWAAERTVEAAFAALQEAGVPAAPVLGVEDMFADPHTTARETVVNIEHHLLGIVPLAGCAIRTAPPIMAPRGRAPDLGEHTFEVMHELGYTPADIAALAAAGAFDGQTPQPTSPSQSSEE